MNRKRKPKRRNPAARALTSSLFRMRIVRPLKGKASYRRRPRHQDGAFSFPETPSAIGQRQNSGRESSCGNACLGLRYM